MSTVSVVVPVYWNEATLPALVERLRAVGEQLRPDELELLFVDDGSGDDSFALLQQEAESDPRVRVVRLSRNFGSNAAILAGLTYASGDAVVVLAADLQDPPELIPELVGGWREGAEVVVAARRSRDDPVVSRFFSAGFNRLFRRFVFRDFPPGGFDFLLVSRRVARLLARMSERNSYIFGQAFWVGFIIVFGFLFILTAIAGLLGVRWIKKGAPPAPTMAIEEAKITKAELSEARR